jgi:hypothetical protein
MRKPTQSNCRDGEKNRLLAKGQIVIVSSRDTDAVTGFGPCDNLEKTVTLRGLYEVPAYDD